MRGCEELVPPTLRLYIRIYHIVLSLALPVFCVDERAVVFFVLLSIDYLCLTPRSSRHCVSFVLSLALCFRVVRI